MYRTEALYDERNQLKQNIQFDDNSENKDTTRVFINEKEVWYISLGLNIGFEENGKSLFRRPILVLKKVGNLFFVVAMTSKGKDKHRFYHKIENVLFNERNMHYKNSSYCILSQVRVIDKKDSQK